MPVRITSAEMPCKHNNWDNVRMKRRVATLRCRVCQIQARTDNGQLQASKCQAWAKAGSCKKGADCPKLHVHPSKQSLAERIEIHGMNLLDKVPEQDRMKTHSMWQVLSVVNDVFASSDDEDQPIAAGCKGDEALTAAIFGGEAAYA